MGSNTIHEAANIAVESDVVEANLLGNNLALINLRVVAA
jgi:hypothetical protein